MKRHLKRVNAPKTWKIPRKSNIFIRRPNSGAHSFELGMSLMTLLKEVEQIATTSREVRYLINQQELFVNGKRVKNPDYLVGLMDTITIPVIKFSKQVSLSEKGVIAMTEVSDKDALHRSLKIISKKQYQGKTQYNCLDGTNILEKKNDHNIGDTLVVTNKDHKVISVAPLKKGAKVLLHAGKNTGTVAKVHNIEGETITLEKDGKTFETKKSYAFVLP